MDIRLATVGCGGYTARLPPFRPCDNSPSTRHFNAYLPTLLMYDEYILAHNILIFNIFIKKAVSNFNRDSFFVFY